MPRVKREISIEGVITIAVLLVNIVLSWAGRDALVRQIKDNLDAQSKIIAALVTDVANIKGKDQLYDYELEQARKHIEKENGNISR